MPKNNFIDLSLKEKSLLPTNDYVFRRLFSHENCKSITKDLLINILNIEIKDISLDHSPILERDLQNDKLGVVDILAIIDENTQCDVEMQVVSYDDLFQRILFYWSRLYSKSITIGDTYSKAKKTIVVLITDFDINFGEYIPEYRTTWRIREDKYTNLILTNMLEICIINLRMFEKMQKENMDLGNSKLASWLRFIQNPNLLEANDMDNVEIQKAKEEYENIMADDEEKMKALRRWIHLMDIQAVEDTGFRKGKEAGVEEGEQIGRKKSKQEIAKKMLSKKMSIEETADITGLSKEEIKELAD